MNTALGIILITLVVMVALWVTIFGTAGAMLARHAGSSRSLGIFLGASLGPIGLIILLIRSRRSHQPQILSDSMVGITIQTSSGTMDIGI
jgi:hypothetical protein